MDPRVRWIVAAGLAAVMGCGSSPDTSGLDAGPKAAFRAWVAVVEGRDYAAMWKLLPETSRDRFAFSWDAEREGLETAPDEVQGRFLSVYGFQSMDQVRAEDARGFFIRSMGRYPKEDLPTKYELLKKAKVQHVAYGDDGATPDLTFDDEDGSPLPMRMKMIREGDTWKVVRLP
jgi:hypothetical protein